MTIPGGYSAGDVLTAANMNLLPAGNLDYAAITANQGSITTITDITSLTVTWTAVSARRYRVSWQLATYSSASGDTVRIACTDSSNTAVSETVTSPVSSVYEHSYSGSITETGLSGSTTRKLRAVRLDGTGNITIGASSGRPAWILVEDIGPA